MKIWWCEEHEQASSVRAICPTGWFADKGCRMVEMQLVPADALVVVKENGEWSDSTVLAFDTAAHALVETHHGREDLRLAFNIFVAALADAASDSANV